ncbi:hypothetical protein ISN44_As01g004170 [Arabidopsis suecica]|uniref:Uncharacterized protein n=1 Tax=Arabidopsis suecica TaxID=45249 RepID=A0A8T2GZA7_ARASU|nr:hypothetical protein ISN44_As01g004170 [Arabidopsis suecica]
MTPILQRHAKRIKSSLFRSYATLWSPEASQTPLIRIKVAFLPTQPVLHQWQQQEKQLYIGGGLIKNLRDSNPFSQQLKASKRMGKEKVCTLFPEDYAARFYLIETVLGLEEAEKFFKSIPSNMRDNSVYSMLLPSYTRSDSVKPDTVTENTVLKVDVKAIKMFMRTWVDEEGIKLQRDTIVEMAKVYVRVCSQMYRNVVGSAREVLQTLWDGFKKSEEVYRTAVSSLSKLDDVEEAEDTYGEWKEDERDISEQVTKKSMMLLHVLNLLLILVTLSLPVFVCPPNLSIPLVVLSVMLTHISITRLLRFIIFSEKE